MPHPVIVPMVVHRHFGSQYAVVTPDRPGSTPTAIALGCVDAAPGYGHLIIAYYDQALDDAIATRLPVPMARIGEFQGLPRFEVVDDQGITLSEHLVQMGYAVPREEALQGHPRAEQLLAALRVARATKAGVWREWTADQYATTLPFTLIARTNPPPPVQALPFGLDVLAILAVILMFIVLAIRDAGYRGGPRRGFFRRWGGRFIGSYGAAGYGPLKPEQIDQVRGALRPPQADEPTKATP